jgi:hypothetical protein
VLVNYTIGNEFPEKKSLVVLQKQMVLSPFSVLESDNTAVLVTAKIKVKLDKSTEAITYPDLKDTEDGKEMPKQ